MKSNENTNVSVEKERPLPESLVRLCGRYRSGSIALFLGLIPLSVFLREPRLLLFLTVSAYFECCGLNIRRDWAVGKIQEIPVCCVQTRSSSIRDRVTVSFCTNPADSQSSNYYQFSLPGRRNEDMFIPGSPYLIYFRTYEPKVLLAFGQIKSEHELPAE